MTNNRAWSTSSETRRAYDDSGEEMMARAVSMTPCRKVLHLPPIWGGSVSFDLVITDAGKGTYHRKEAVEILIVVSCPVIYGLHGSIPAFTQLLRQRLSQPFTLEVCIRERIAKRKTCVCPSHGSLEAGLDLWDLIGLLVTTVSPFYQIYRGWPYWRERLWCGWGSNCSGGRTIGAG